MEKIKYQCKNCGWETAIRQEWGDLRPKRCMNKKCNTSFVKNREALITTHPEKKEAPVVAAKQQPKQQDRKHGKASHKPKEDSQSEQQQTEE